MATKISKVFRPFVASLSKARGICQTFSFQMFVFFYSPDADVQNQQSLAYLQLEQQIFIMKHK